MEGRWIWYRRGRVKLPDINDMMVYLEKFSCTYAKYIVAL